MAEIGTPSESSHSGAMRGHCDAGAVKRALGWAAGTSDSGVQSLPFQSMPWAGGADQPSHQTSPASVGVPGGGRLLGQLCWGVMQGRCYVGVLVWAVWWAVGTFGSGVQPLPPKSTRSAARFAYPSHLRFPLPVSGDVVNIQPLERPELGLGMVWSTEEGAMAK